MVEKSAALSQLASAHDSSVKAPRMPSPDVAFVTLSCQMAEAERSTYGPSAAAAAAGMAAIASDAQSEHPLFRMV
jgi:hypothetical protein